MSILKLNDIIKRQIELKNCNVNWVYSAVVSDVGYGLGIVKASEAGYEEISPFFCSISSFDDAIAYATELNEERNVNSASVALIVTSSMQAKNLHEVNYA